MTSIRVALVVGLPLALAGCAHASRPPLSTRAALDEVALVAPSTPVPLAVTRQARQGATVAGYTTLGTVTGFFFPFAVCGLGGKAGKELATIGVLACGFGLFAVGGPELIVGVLAVSTVVGAAWGGSKGAAKTRPAREAGAAAEALLRRRAPPPHSVGEWLVEGAAGAGAESGFRLAGAAPTAADARDGGATVRVEVTALVFEPDGSGLLFALRVDGRATLVAGGRESGRGEATVRSGEAWDVAGWDGPEHDGAPFVAAIRTLVRDAAAAATADLLVPLGRSDRAAYPEAEVCGLGPTTPDGRHPVEGFGVAQEPLRVSPTERVLRWEPWLARPEEQVTGAVVTYDLRVWNESGAVVVDARDLAHPTYALGPELQERVPYSWSTRAVVTSRGRRFVTTWSRHRAAVGCALPEPDATSRFRLTIAPDMPPAQDFTFGGDSTSL